MISLLQHLSARERILLGSFLVVMLLIWGSSLLDRWDRSGETLREASNTVDQQKVWLENAGFLEEQFQSRSGGLDPGDMLDSSEVSALVDTYARDNELNYELGEPTVREGEVFTRAAIRATFRNIPLQKLIELHLLLQEKRPYLAVEAIALASNRADPRLLNVRIDLASIEIHTAAESPSR